MQATSGIQITQDSLSAMIYHISAQICSKIIILYEEESTNESINKTVECVLRVLLGEYFPNCANIKQIGLKTTISEFVTDRFLQYAERIFKNWESSWPVLADSNSLSVFNRFKAKVIPAGIAGGHIKNFVIKPDKISKRTKKAEIVAYNLIYDKYPQLKEFFPEYYGSTVDSEGNVEIIIENITQGEVYNSIDLKLWSSGKERHNALTFVHKYYFFAAGVQIFNQDNEIIEQRRQNSILFEEEELDNLIRRFFYHKDVRMLQNKLQNIINFLNKLLNFIEFSPVSLRKTSLLLFYNPFNDVLRLKVIDLTYLDETLDPNATVSYKGMLSYFSKLKAKLSEGQ